MAPKTQNINGRQIHFSVGAIIEKNGKYLLLDRVTEPLGFAGIAGHINNGEMPELALQRKVLEESGFHIQHSSLLFEELVDWNWCTTGMQSHYWYVYKCEVTGTLKNNKKASKSVGWYSKDEIKKLVLEPVLKKLAY